MKALLLTLLTLLISAAGARADEVSRWNRVAAEQSAAVHTDPVTETRIFAMLHLAVHGAVSAAEARETGADPRAAAAAAAHDVLLPLLPSGTAAFDLALEESMRALPKGAAAEKGLSLGRREAQAVLSARKSDGASRAASFGPGSKQGEYRPTPPDLTPAFMAQWGGVKPFALASAAQFRPGPPPAVDGERARADVEAVRALGAEKGASRDEEQTEVARFWYENSVQGWNRITRTVAEARGLGLHDEARLFALVNLAIADGMIACFDAKYHYAYWRPVTAIREGGDAGWLSFLPTPPIPDYPSGHATMGAAAAEVLARFFGTDYVPFQVTSGEPYGGITRRFWSFSQAARENEASRVFAGIHFPTAVAEGDVLGRSVGGFVFEKALR